MPAAGAFGIVTEVGAEAGAAAVQQAWAAALVQSEDLALSDHQDPLF